MSLQQKFEAASAIVSEHNKALPESLKDKALNWEEIYQKIIEAGGTSEENLNSLTWEDLQECGLPKLLARRIAKEVFRERSHPTPVSYLPKMVTQMQAASMSIEDLLKNFDPEGIKNSAVTNRLMELSKGLPFIVYDTLGRVVPTISIRLLKEIRGGTPPREYFTYEGKPVKVWEANKKPQGFFDENPLYPKHALREDQTCTLTERSWEKVPLQVRQILYLALTQTKELRINDKTDIHDTLDRIEGKTLEEVISRYPKASMVLEEMSRLGQTLPLKVLKPSGIIVDPSQLKNNPFYEDRHRRF
jgi:hypothetical protein